jgi:hypothetical protein
LSPGTYNISARSVKADGTTFQSSAQQVTIGVSPTVPTPTPTPVESFARQRPATSPSQGTALPRLPPSSGDVSGGRSSNALDAPVTLQVHAQVSLAWILATLDQLQTVAHGGASVVHDISIVDEDGDGTIDYVRAIVGGRVRIWRIAQ